MNKYPVRPDLQQPGPAPLEIEVWRGKAVESRHHVSVAVIDPKQNLVAAWGNPALPCYPRSAVKPLQSLPLIESGAADAFRLTDAELTLACSSHGGELDHVQAVAEMLGKAGLTESDLACGSHWPLYAPSAEAMMRRAESPNQLHNNCSGEHAGMLLTCRHLGNPVKDYLDRTHPAQKRIETALSEMCDFDLTTQPEALDGCSAPVFAIPLERLALGMARFAAPDTQSSSRDEACRRLFQAITRKPRMIAGTDRFCTALNQAAHGMLVSKTGAEGVMCASVPAQQERPALGIALKVHDGTTRAAECALVTVLDALGLVDDQMRPALARYFRAEVRNWKGRLTGHILAKESGANLVRLPNG